MIGKIILVNMNFFGRMFDFSPKILYYIFKLLKITRLSLLEITGF